VSKPSIVAEWAQSGLAETLLPQSGLWAQLRLPSLERLARRGLMPERLVQEVIGADGNAGKAMEAVAAKTPDEQRAIIEEGFQFNDSMVATMIVALKRQKDDPWEKVNLTPAQVPDVIPDRDLEALRRIANRDITPGMATIVARRIRGELTEDEATALVEEEAKHAAERVVGGWSSFRGLGSGEEPRPDGKGLEGPTKLADRRRRSGHRVSAG